MVVSAEHGLVAGLEYVRSVGGDYMSCVADAPYVDGHAVVAQVILGFGHCARSLEEAPGQPVCTERYGTACVEVGGILAPCVVAEFLLYLCCLLLDLVEASEEPWPEVAEDYDSAECAEDIRDSISHGDDVELAGLFSFGYRELADRFGSDAYERRAGLSPGKKPDGLALGVGENPGHEQGDAETHRAHHKGKAYLLEPRAFKRLEEIGPYAVAYREEEHHEEDGLQRPGHGDVELAYYYASQKHGGDIAEREVAELDTAEQESEADGEEDRQGRVVSQDVYCKVEHMREVMRSEVESIGTGA